MNKLHYLFKIILSFVVGYFIFIIFFIIAEFIFYRLLGITIDFLLIYLNNFKILCITYVILYALINIIIFFYDHYYIRKLNKILKHLQVKNNNSNIP